MVNEWLCGDRAHGAALALVAAPPIFGAMRSARRILAVLLLLTWGLGMPVLSAQAGEMAQHAVQAAADGPAPMDCGDCGAGKMAMSAAVCSATCVGSQAKDFVSGTLATAAADFDILSEGRFSGSINSPEPYPPKPTILS